MIPSECTLLIVAVWGIVAAGYGLVLGFAAVTQPIRHRTLALMAALAYALIAVGSGTLASSLWVNLIVPGALLLTGYWLSGFFFRDPQPWLEAWLVRLDRVVAADRWMNRLPRVAAELLELTYTAVHVVVGGGAIYAATFGTEAVAHYWSLVLTSALASYAPLPWLRSRPPRALESVGVPGLYMRRLNTMILDSASVHANTLPSGHVSGAVAAALGVMAVNPVAGWGGIVLAGLIAIAAIAGRYHYAVDCAAGAAVALAFWSLM